MQAVVSLIGHATATPTARARAAHLFAKPFRQNQLCASLFSQAGTRPPRPSANYWTTAAQTTMRARPEPPSNHRAPQRWPAAARAPARSAPPPNPSQTPPGPWPSPHRIHRPGIEPARFGCQEARPQPTPVADNWSRSAGSTRPGGRGPFRPPITDGAGGPSGRGIFDGNPSIAIYCMHASKAKPPAVAAGPPLPGCLLKPAAAAAPPPATRRPRHPPGPHPPCGRGRGRACARARPARVQRSAPGRPAPLLTFSGCSWGPLYVSRGEWEPLVGSEQVASGCARQRVYGVAL
jgi:hypothetical protein